MISKVDIKAMRVWRAAVRVLRSVAIAAGFLMSPILIYYVWNFTVFFTIMPQCESIYAHELSEQTELTREDVEGRILKGFRPSKVKKYCDAHLLTRMDLKACGQKGVSLRIVRYSKLGLGCFEVIYTPDGQVRSVVPIYD